MSRDYRWLVHQNTFKEHAFWSSKNGPLRHLSACYSMYLTEEHELDVEPKSKCKMCLRVIAREKRRNGKEADT